MKPGGCDFQAGICEAVIAHAHSEWGWGLEGGLVSSGSRNRSSRQSPVAGRMSMASSCLCSPGTEDALACRGASRKRRRVNVLEPGASQLRVAVLHLFPPLPPAWLLRGWRSPLLPAAPCHASLASPALFTAVPDVQLLAGAPMTWECKYLLFLPRTRSGDSQVTLPWLC